MTTDSIEYKIIQLCLYLLNYQSLSNYNWGGGAVVTVIYYKLTPYEIISGHFKVLEFQSLDDDFVHHLITL